MNEATQTTASLASEVTAAVDQVGDFIVPIGDALGPLVGPKLAVALPWLAGGLAVALPVCVALWPFLYKLAAIIPGNLDTWLLDRIGALLQRLAKWMLRKDVKLVDDD